MNKLTKKQDWRKMNNKKGEKFRFGLFVVIISIIISLFAFVSENSRTTGFAVLEGNENNAQDNIGFMPENLIEFDEVNSLSTLAPGNYFIDDDGIVYWIDDDSKPAIAIVKSHDETYENRHIYIDDEGTIGYVLSSVLINENSG